MIVCSCVTMISRLAIMDSFIMLTAIHWSVKKVTVTHMHGWCMHQATSIH